MWVEFVVKRLHRSFKSNVGKASPLTPFVSVFSGGLHAGKPFLIGALVLQGMQVLFGWIS